MDEPTETETFDPTKRRLCADGACVGLIGDDGKCNVCGRTEEQAAAGEAPIVTDDLLAAEGGATDGGFDAKRRLCDDGSCVGVIGEDGTCRVCGRHAD
ncbi:MAG TPA: hypothetical protein VHJ20_02400 [Polyangia bacterium]|nr:hypothetical protein [Polyangia bacterium]